MTEEKTDEIRLPNWLGDREQFHMMVKKEKKLTEYQLWFFERELKHQKKLYEGLKERTQQREKSYKPRFKTREELDEAYMLGGMTVKEYMIERRNIWNCYSDRGYLDRIAWLEEQAAKYREKLEDIEGWTERTRKHSTYLRGKKRNVREKHINAVKRYKKKVRMKKLEERWRKYGLIK